MNPPAPQTLDAIILSGDHVLCRRVHQKLTGYRLHRILIQQPAQVVPPGRLKRFHALDAQVADASHDAVLQSYD